MEDVAKKLNAILCHYLQNIRRYSVWNSPTMQKYTRQVCCSGSCSRDYSCVFGISLSDNQDVMIFFLRYG